MFLSICLSWTTPPSKLYPQIITFWEWSEHATFSKSKKITRHHLSTTPEKIKSFDSFTFKIVFHAIQWVYQFLSKTHTLILLLIWELIPSHNTAVFFFFFFCKIQSSQKPLNHFTISVNEVIPCGIQAFKLLTLVKIST